MPMYLRYLVDLSSLLYFLLSWLVYDRNHYFGLGPIPKLKPKLPDTFGRYRKRYRNHISKGESSYQYQTNLALVMGIFSNIKGALKTKFACKFSILLDYF